MLEQWGSRRRVIIWLLLLTVAGCTSGLTMVARDSGKTHPAAMRIPKPGQATISANLDGERYSGPLNLSGSEGFGLIPRYGAQKNVPGGNELTNSAPLKGTAILTSSAGHAIRCEFANLPHGLRIAAICLDDAERVYDIR
jgi:hypothetical protein